jgi:hypothetical protein
MRLQLIEQFQASEKLRRLPSIVTSDWHWRNTGRKKLHVFNYPILAGLAPFLILVYDYFSPYISASVPVSI